MSYNCKILLDSTSETGRRITTMEITFPRIVLAEFNTHRMFSRNSASSRAIPISKMIKRVRTNPFIPEKWGKPAVGMGAKEYWPLDSTEHIDLNRVWESALNNTLNLVIAAKNFGNKEDLNRLLEPFMYHTALITATEWDNFFKLRTNEAADWKIRKIADLMYEAYHAYDNDKEYLDNNFQESSNKGWKAIPKQKLKVGEWHCPLVSKEDDELIWQYIENPNRQFLSHLSNPNAIHLEFKKKISVARSARVSYLTHDGKRDIEKDLELFERLRTSGHFSPFEHVATPSFTNGEGIRDSILLHKILDVNGNIRNANFWGWKQMRQDLPNENCINFRKEN